MEVSQHVRAILSFVEAAHLNNFSAAARKLGISAAAVSKNIASLEVVLGVRLMNRTTRKISLTEEGQVFLYQAKIALDALELAADNIIERKMDTIGHVRISTSAAFGRYQILPILPGLLSHYPSLSVEVDFDDRITDLVQDGYDLAIRGGRILDSSLISRPVCKLKTVIVASPEYLAKNGTPKTPDELSQHRLIARRFLGNRVDLWGFKQPDGSLVSFEPTPAALTLSAPEAVVQAACSGLGIAQVGVHNALKHFQNGTLKVVLLDQHDSGNYEMVIQYPHRALIAPRVKVTVDYLLAALKKDKSLHFPIDKLVDYQ